MWSCTWKARLRSRQNSVQVPVALLERSRAIGNRVQSGPKSSRHGAAPLDDRLPAKLRAVLVQVPQQADFRSVVDDLVEDV